MSAQLPDVDGFGEVVAVCRSARHEFSKQTAKEITLAQGEGVVGDCHFGVTVQHLSRVRRDPTQPNLRQVHLIASELLAELAASGFDVRPGDLGENVLTAGIDLLALATDTRLRLGREVVVRVTGLRNPCVQIDHFSDGLLAQVVGRDDAGRVERRAGVMAVVEVGGRVREGDTVAVVAPAGPARPLQPV